MKKFFRFSKGRRDSDASSSKPSSSGMGSRQSSMASLSSQSVGGYDVREKDLGKLHRASWTGDVTKVRTLVRSSKTSVADKDNRTPLHLACARGHTEVVEALLEWKASVNVGDNEKKTPLLKAVECNQVTCVKLLLGAKADINVKDRLGNTGLHYSARDGSHDMVSLLTSALPQRNAMAQLEARNDDGFTPLHLAALDNHKMVCSDLLEAGADIDAQDPTGKTALMLACRSGFNDIAKLLLEYEADSTIKDKDGWTADDFAVRGGHDMCRKAIADNQAEPPSTSSAAAARPRVPAAAAKNDDESDDDEEEESQTAGNGDPRSWQDSDTESEEAAKPTRVSLAMNNLSKNAPKADDHIVPEYSPGYETINFVNNVKASPAKTGDAGIAPKKSPALPSTSVNVPPLGIAGTAGAGKRSTDELQIPQSARSTLSGHSWLSDKWSDDEDEIEDAVMSARSTHSAKHTSSVAAKPPPPSLPVSVLGMQSPQGLVAGANTSKDKQMMADLGLDEEISVEVSSVKGDLSPRKHQDSARSNPSDWDSSDSTDAPGGAAGGSVATVKGYVPSVSTGTAPGVNGSGVKGSVSASGAVNSSGEHRDSRSTSAAAAAAVKSLTTVTEHSEPVYSTVDKTRVAHLPPHRPAPQAPPLAILNQSSEDEESESESTWEAERKQAKTQSMTTDNPAAAAAVAPADENASLAKPPVAAAVVQSPVVKAKPSTDDVHMEVNVPVPNIGLSSSTGAIGLSSSTGIGRSKLSDASVQQLQHDSPLKRDSMTKPETTQTVSLSSDIGNVIRLQEELRDTQTELAEERSSKLSLENRLKTLQSDRDILARKLDEEAREKFSLSEVKIKLEAKLRNAESELREEIERRKNADVLSEKIKEQLTGKDELNRQLMQSNETLEVSLKREEQLRLRLATELKQLEEDKAQLELELRQKKSVVVHDVSVDKSNAAVTKSPDAARPAGAGLHGSAADIYALKERSDEALTQANLSYSLEIGSLRAELEKMTVDLSSQKDEKLRLETSMNSLKSQLNEANLELDAVRDANRELEKQMQQQADKWRHTLELREQELIASQSTVQNQSSQLSEFRTKLSKIESELKVTSTSLQERASQLTSLQRDLDQKQTQCETLDDNWHKEKEINIRLQAKLELHEEKLIVTTQELERLRQNSDADRVGQPEKLTVLLSELREDRDRVKSELQDKNASLSNSLAKTKEELRSAERDRSLAEDENRRLQSQLSNLQRQVSTGEAALELSNQSRQQMEAETLQLRRQIDSLKDALDAEKQRTAMTERRVVELNDKLRSAENAAANTADRLTHESSSLSLLSQTKRELEESVHRLELENARLDMALNHERQKSEILQKEYNEARQAQKSLFSELSSAKANSTQLQCLVNEASGMRQQATQEADDNRALWENEIKSRSKLGLRIAQLEREKNELLGQLSEEKRRSRKALEMKKTVEERLALEVEKSNQMRHETVTLKTHLKTAKKRLKDNSMTHHQKPIVSAPNITNDNESDMDLALLHVQRELEDAKIQLHREVSNVGHVAGDMSQFANDDRLSYSMPADLHSSRPSDDRLAAYKLHLSGTYTEKSELQRLKAELEARAQKELDAKLEEVNAYLGEQMRARERLDRIRDNNEVELRKEFESMRKELLDEVLRLRRNQRDSAGSPHNKDDLNRQTKHSQQQMKELYETETRLRQKFAHRLDKASEAASRAQAFTDHQQQQQPSRGSDSDASFDSVKLQLDRSISRHLDNGVSFTAKSLAGEAIGGSVFPVASINGSASDFMSSMQRTYLLQ